MKDMSLIMKVGIVGGLTMLLVPIISNTELLGYFLLAALPVLLLLVIIRLMSSFGKERDGHSEDSSRLEKNKTQEYSYYVKTILFIFSSYILIFINSFIVLKLAYEEFGLILLYSAPFLALFIPVYVRHFANADIRKRIKRFVFWTTFIIVLGSPLFFIIKTIIVSPETIVLSLTLGLTLTLILYLPLLVAAWLYLLLLSKILLEKK